ncbi:MAG: VIT1/CCC1 transporter family protein [Pseudomonadota bacterium]
MSDALKGWREEMQSAWLYARLAECEPDPRLAALFGELAEAALEQAAIWADKLPDGSVVRVFRPSARARLVAHLARVCSPRRIRPVLAAMKVRGLSAYQGAMAPSSHPGVPLKKPESFHLGGGSGMLRAAVFGVNDGLVSNTSLMMGIAGATLESGAIITAGVAGLMAGALSMAAGEYVSMRSQREMYEYQIALERAEIEAYPKEEAEELAQIYHARGMDLDAAREAARKMMEDPEHALDVLSREELGLNPDDLGSPWGAAVFSFGAFVLGALVPLLPYVAGMQGLTGLTWSAVLAAVSLFGVGAALSLFSGRSAIYGGLRMLVIGALAGSVTYGIGVWIGAGIS